MTRSYRSLAARTIERCRDIAACSDVAGETTRLFLAPSMRSVHALARDWMEAAGMTVWVDAVGNLRGVYPGAESQCPRLIVGSHLDTVPNAGAFDGVLGVLLAIAMVEKLDGRRLPFAIEVIGFSEEEGVRFSKPFLGSLALVGRLDAESLACKDRDGISVAEAIQAFGLAAAELPAAALSEDAFAFIEFHIEQGPLLESEGASLGIVEALVGQTREQFVFCGQANHAGTTPMHLRHDAMAAAAEWIVAVEAYANSKRGLVATVGRVAATPGAGNVIAGEVTASLDVRHAQDKERTAAVDYLAEAARVAARRRGVTVAINRQMEQSAVRMDNPLSCLLHRAASQAGYPSRIMTSGAGHDAMIVAHKIPSTMLFLRSPGGLSHHPEESVLLEDVEAALATAMEFLALLGDDRASTKDIHA